jgi:hypothetical protein
VIASVSKLALWRPLNADGDVAVSELLPESMWKGNEPRPDDAVENWELVESPSIRLSGGAGSSESDTSPAPMASFEERLPLKDWDSGVVGLPLNDCWANGETGGVRIGLSEIGEGGTKGNDSRIESARVDVEDSTDEPETLLSKPCACARAWA